MEHGVGSTPHSILHTHYSPLQLFYDPELQIGTHRLREAEAKHAFQVLRKRVGDELRLVDGNGGWYTATVVTISKRECLLDVTMTRQESNRADYSLHLLVAPTKNIDRFEWVLEKATEIGVDHIQPVLTEHSERKRIRTDRLERILEAAMKQSLHAFKPTLGELLPFSQAIAVAPADHDRFLAYLGAEEAPLLHQTVTPRKAITVAIGPEGGFSPAEAALAQVQGFTFTSLGPNRLRTETAAVAAVHTVGMVNW